MNQVHKETLDQVENALPNRQGLDIEIFGMEGIPSEVLDTHRQRLVQNFYTAQEERRLATGNPLPGQAIQRKKIKIETAAELKARLAEWRAKKKAGLVDVMEGVIPTPVSICARFNDMGRRADVNVLQKPQQQFPGYPQPPAALPQRPMGVVMPGNDDIDNLIRMAEAGARAPPAEEASAAAAKSSKKDKEKKGRMIYDDAEYSPEEHMAALPRYAFTPA